MKTIPDIKTTLSSIGKKEDGISFRMVRSDKLPYMLAYAFELILYASWGHFTPKLTDRLFGVPGEVLVYAAHVVMSLVIMLLWNDHFKHLLRISVVIMLLGFLSAMIVSPSGKPYLLLCMIGYAGLGGAVTSARCGFAFVANNAERLFGMLIMFLGNAAVYFLDSVLPEGCFVEIVIILFFLGSLAFLLLTYKEEDFEVKKETTKADTKGIYWALAYFIAYFMIDGYVWNLVDYSKTSQYRVICLGMLFAAGILVLLLANLKLNVWHAWNVFFVFAVIMSLFAIFAPSIGTDYPEYFMIGLTLMGWPLCIYVLACAQKRFASYKLLKQCTLIFAILSPFTTMSDDIIKSYKPEYNSVACLVVVLAILLVFFMLSPYSHRNLFSQAWVSEFAQNDMKALIEKVETVDRFSSFGLTPRQKEVAILLLAAKTRRQISGELGLSESTVKTHVSELYKKLNINSRAELFQLFGVAKTAKIDQDEETGPQI
ncbi:MAG: helix-turn-helix transcriptional regulator [Lachnospiraceae bacterium]|nr:helix-turn-helix transcriptional regulator [Lachnospiraceae bacterium]